jgi:hypothetical protein
MLWPETISNGANGTAIACLNERSLIESLHEKCRELLPGYEEAGGPERSHLRYDPNYVDDNFAQSLNQIGQRISVVAEQAPWGTGSLQWGNPWQGIYVFRVKGRPIELTEFA